MDPTGNHLAGGARCAEHAERDAVGTCERCGAYLCSECSEAGTRTLCHACRERLGTADFPYDRHSWSFDRLFSLAWDRWKPEWLMLSLAMLIVMGIGWFVSMLPNLAQVLLGAIDPKLGIAALGILMLVQVVVQGVVQLGMIRVCTDVLQGRPADLARLFSQFPKTAKFLGQMVLLYGIVGIPLMLYGGIVAGILYAIHGLNDPNVVGPVIIAAAVIAIGPLVWLGISILFAQMELATDDSVGAVESIRRSFALVKGQRLAVFAFSFVAGLAGLLGLVACCIGVVASLSFSQLALVALYLALRNGSGLPAPVQA